MAAIFSSSTKTMLKNVIQHTKSHNKVKEESLMWQQLSRLNEQRPSSSSSSRTKLKSKSLSATGLKELEGLNPRNSSFCHDDRCEPRHGRNGRGDDCNRRSSWRSPSDSRSRHRERRAHMDEEMEDRRVISPGQRSTYWMRQLQKVELSDPNRWDHSGFKELYPNDFDSDRSFSYDSSSEKHRKSRKKTSKKSSKKSGTKRKKQVKQKKSSHKHQRHTEKRRNRSSSSSDSSDSSDSEASKHRLMGKGKRTGWRRKSGRSALSSSESSWGTDSSSSSDLRNDDDRRQSRRLSKRKKVQRSHRTITPESSSDSESPVSQRKRKLSHNPRRQSSPSPKRVIQAGIRTTRLRTRSRSDRNISSNVSYTDSSSTSSASSSSSGLGRHRGNSKHKNKKSLQREELNSTALHKFRQKQKFENNLVVELWKELNADRLASRRKHFDRQLKSEIKAQYVKLKHKYLKTEIGKSIEDARKKSDGSIVQRLLAMSQGLPVGSRGERGSQDDRGSQGERSGVQLLQHRHTVYRPQPSQKGKGKSRRLQPPPDNLGESHRLQLPQDNVGESHQLQPPQDNLGDSYGLQPSKDHWDKSPWREGPAVYDPAQGRSLMLPSNSFQLVSVKVEKMTPPLSPDQSEAESSTSNSDAD